jgi:hypothetical protein
MAARLTRNEIQLVDMTENGIERLGTTESNDIGPQTKEGSKIRVTSLLWQAPR